MLFLKKIAALLTLLSIVTGCQKDTPGSQVPEQQSLTVLFSPGVSFSGACYDDAILKAVVESMAEHPQVNHSLSPGKGRVLLLDSRQTLENGVATVQLKRYGGNANEIR